MLLYLLIFFFFTAKQSAESFEKALRFLQGIFNFIRDFITELFVYLFSELTVNFVGKPVFSSLNECLFEFFRQALDIKDQARFGDRADNSYCCF